MLLFVVLVVIAILSLSAGTFAKLMLSEREAVQLSARRTQARALAESGIEMARAFLGCEEQAQIEAGGWYDNSQHFQAVLVIDDPSPYQRGRFGLVAPLLEDGQFAGIRFGLEDESARLNLNAVALATADDEETGRQILMGLPGMNEEIADAILDWIDEDDQVRQFGAESEYYQALDPPYRCRNGPITSLDELLLVRGVTPGLLYGVDANRNMLADATEPDPLTVAADVDNSDGSLNLGWAAYLTLYSVEKNVRPDGTPKINLNQDDLEALFDTLTQEFGEDVATFVVAYRQFGPSQTDAPGRPTLPRQLDLSRPAQQTLSSVLDLIGTKVEVQLEGEAQPVVLESPIPDTPGAASELVADLMDNCTTSSAVAIPGRININQAPRVVLGCIPGITPEVVDQIVGLRQPDPVLADPQRRHPTWLWDEGIVTLEEMKRLAPFVTGAGSVFRAQAIGYFDKGGPAVRIEVVLDATARPVRVVSWKDISHLGPGYATEILGTEATESGSATSAEAL